MGKPKNAKEAAELMNIGGSTNTSGSLLTLSIHAKQEKVIKMYLFCNGQCIRFMPEDIKTVLPVLFNMDYGDNRNYLDGKEINDNIQAMQERIVDENFEAFQQSFCN